MQGARWSHSGTGCPEILGFAESRDHVFLCLGSRRGQGQGLPGLAIRVCAGPCVQTWGAGRAT